MAGVKSQYRRKGLLTELTKYQEQWAKEKGYNRIKTRTRNDRREMLIYLIKTGFNICNVVPTDLVKNRKILLEKDLR